MKRFQDLKASDFPGASPEKFAAWKRAELSFQAGAATVAKIGLMAMILMFATVLFPLAHRARLVIAVLLAASFWFCYANLVLRISPKGKAVKALWKDTGIHWKELWAVLGLFWD